MNIKGNGYNNTFKGSISVIFFAPFWKGVCFRMKEFAPHGSKFFAFKVDGFSEGAVCAGK